jgi:hypothetical protein
MMADVPLGLSEDDINVLRQELPGGRGMLRIDRYYRRNGATHVVYDVLDENGHQFLDNQI